MMILLELEIYLLLTTTQTGVHLSPVFAYHCLLVDSEENRNKL